MQYYYTCTIPIQSIQNCDITPIKKIMVILKCHVSMARIQEESKAKTKQTKSKKIINTISNI